VPVGGRGREWRDNPVCPVLLLQFLTLHIQHSHFQLPPPPPPTLNPFQQEHSGYIAAKHAGEGQLEFTTLVCEGGRAEQKCLTYILGIRELFTPSASLKGSPPPPCCTPHNPLPFL
jgi:hypothetical protein